MAEMELRARETLLRALNEAEAARMRAVEERDGLRTQVSELRQQVTNLSQVYHLTFLTERVAYHLNNGCDTPEKARELALVEWRVGVLGEKS